MKKESSNKKSKLILIIAIALVAVLAVAGVVLALTMGGGEGESAEPEVIKSEIYYNVDREAMLDLTTGLSQRKTESDGFIRIRFIVGGEEVTLPTTDRKLVNKIDSLEFVCLKLDADGVIVDASDAGEAYVRMHDKAIVQNVDGNTVTVNTSMALNGMQKKFTIPAGVKAWNVSKRITGVCSGEETTLELLDQVVVFGTDEETPYEVFMTDRYWESKIYWSTANRRYWNATAKASTRPAAEDGYWYIELVCEGETKTYRTAKQDVINVLDSKGPTDAVTGVVFNEEGDMIDLFNAGIAARGIVTANNFDITQLSDDGKTFTATRVLFGTEVGKTYTGTITEETKIYNVNRTADKFGEATELKMNDRILVIQRADGVIDTIFVTNRMVPGPMYYNIDQKWSSTLGHTRVPDENGWYVFQLAADGKIKTVKTKDKEIASLMDQTSLRIFGLKLKGDVVVKYYEAVNVAGNYSFASNNFVTNTTGGVLGTVNASGTAANGVMSENCKVFDVSGCYKEFKGEKTKVREGDQVVCYQNALGEVTHIWVLNRYMKGTTIYWNCNRYYANGETTRTPDENGYYVFNVIKLGSTKVTQLKTKDKEIASRFDKENSTTAAALKVSNGIIKAAYPAPCAIGGYYRLPGFWIMDKSEQYSNGYRAIASTGAIGTLLLSGDCKIYDFSNTAKVKGEKTKLRENDRVWPIAGTDGNVQILFVIERSVPGSKLAWMRGAVTTPDANGYYNYTLLVNGKVGTYKTNDADLATYINGRISSGFAVTLKGNVITGAYPSSCAEGVRSSTISYQDFVSIKDGKLNTQRNKVGASDAGATSSVPYSSNPKIYMVDASKPDSEWGKKAKLTKGDRIYALSDTMGETKYIFIAYDCTLPEGNMRYCEHCGKKVHWESIAAGYGPSAGFEPETAHYYLASDRATNSMISLGNKDTSIATEFVVDLNGKTMTRSTTTGNGTSGMLQSGAGSTVIITDLSKAQTGKMVTVDGINFTTGQALLAVQSGSKMIIEKGLFDASKAKSSYTNAASGAISVGGELVINGGTIKGWTSSGNGSAIGGWGDSKITVNGGTVIGGTLKTSISGTGYGGTIYTNGDLTVNGGTIKGGTAEAGGDNIYFGRAAKLTINGGTIDGGIQVVNAGAKVTLSGKPVVSEGKTIGLNVPSAVKIDATGLKKGAEVYVDASGIFTTEFASEDAAQAALDNGMLKNGAETMMLARNGKAIESKDDGLVHLWKKSGELPKSGNWKLDTDVTVANMTELAGDLYIDLNGHTVTRNVAASVTADQFLLKTAGKKLTVADTSVAKNGTMKVVPETGCAFKSSAGVIYGNGGSTVIIDGGIIDGSAVANTYTGANAGTITVSKDLIVNGGKIIGYNTSGNGSAIGSWGGTSVTINGGEIVGGTVTKSINGTGFGGAMALNGNLTITGGTITEGSASERGDSIFVNNANAVVSIEGGTISGGVVLNNFKTAAITGATKIGQGDQYGLKLGAGKTVNMQGLTGEVYVDADGVFTTNFASAADAQAMITNGKIKLGKTVSERVLKVAGTAIKVATPVVFDPNIVYDWNAQNAADYLGTSGTDLHKTNLPKDGKWKLVDNVTISASVTMTGNMTLDLNNKIVTRNVTSGQTSNQFALLVNGNTLTIDDTSTEKQGTIKTVVASGVAFTSQAGVIYANALANNVASTLILKNGIIDASGVTSNYITAYSGAITVGNATGKFSTFQMDGGTIKGQRSTKNPANWNSTFNSGSCIGAHNGCAVTINGGKLIAPTSNSNTDYVSCVGTCIAAGNGAITINDGELLGSRAATHGGTIYCNGNLTINGGTISGGTSTNSGNICSSGGVLTITGGTITGGSSGVSSRGKNIDKAGGTLIIKDGADGSHATIAGGISIRSTTTLDISGKAVIDQNLQTQKAGNIWVEGGTPTVKVAGAAKSLVTGTKYSLKYKCDTIVDIFAGNENIVEHNIQNGACSDCGNSYVQVNLSKTAVELEIGDDETITAATTPSTATVTWTSSDNAVATVADGKITAVGAGSATITATATDGTYTSTATVAVTVKAPLNLNVVNDWDATNAVSYLGTSGADLHKTNLPKEGKWKLTSDVTIGAHVLLSNDLWIDLNGYTITRSVTTGQTTKQYVFNVNNAEHTLTIDDLSGKTGDALGKLTASYASGLTCGTSGGLIQVDAGELIFNNGIIDGTPITANITTVNNAAVMIADRFTMNGGIIKGQYSKKYTSSGQSGSAIGAWGNSTVVINGGTIQAYQVTGTSYACSSGACIATSGNLTINGGELIGSCAGARGGAIYATKGGTNSAVTINGGTIKNSFGLSGGAIFVQNSNLTINGGVIVGNKAANAAQGHTIDSVGNTLTIGGNAVISGGVTVRGNAKLVLKDSPVISDKLGTAYADITLNSGSAYLGDTTGTAIQTANGNYSLTYGTDGKVNGLTAYAAAAVTESATIPTKGAVKLTAPVTLDATLVTTGDLYIDLNGQTVTNTVAGPAIKASHSVIITDSSAAKTGKIVTSTASMNSSASVILVDNGKSLVLMGGTLDASAVKNSYAGAAGAAVTAGNDAKFVMLGGEVKGQTGTSTSTGKGGSCVAGWGNSTIVIYGGKLTAKNNGTSFPAHQAAATGTCINTTGNVFVHGGELHGTMANTHGANIFCTGNLTITGGLISGGYANNSGLISSSGASCTITGGTLVGGKAHAAAGGLGGASIDYAKNGGVLTIGGTAKIAGGVSIRSSAKLVLTGKAVIDMNMEGQTQKLFNIRFKNGTCSIYLHDTTGTALASGGTGSYDVTYDAAGNITGITAK